MLDGYSNVGYGMDGSHMPPRNMGMDVGSNMFATQKPYCKIDCANIASFFFHD
jgi:hypothetical protein